ncbi:MAG TPA: hypothetical protein VN521_01365, partial [Negativicutes bacterium]|nr:hypothetical protein [Negativicutes bacterium]
MQRKWQRRWQRAVSKQVAAPVTAGLMFMNALCPALTAAATLPTGGAIVAGSGSIMQTGNTMTVNQTTGSMIANWQT